MVAGGQQFAAHATGGAAVAVQHVGKRAPRVAVRLVVPDMLRGKIIE